MMEHQPDRASELTLKLAARTYVASQVIEATGISPDMLTNYLTKAGIGLCSQAPGRGRPRAFCYVDVLQLKLLAGLVDLIGNADWSARALEYLLFQEVTQHDLGSLVLDNEGPGFQQFKTSRSPEERIEQINHLRGQFCANVTKAPPIYWGRPFGSLGFAKWLLYADRLNIQCGQFKLTAFRSDLNADAVASSPGLRGGYILNATSILDDVDRKLDRLIHPEQPA